MEVEYGSVEEKIINASFDMIEKEGISGATTKKIAECAGVSEVTLFRKFKSKKQLIETAKEYYCNSLIEKLEKIFEFDETVTIEEYVRNSFYKVVNLTEHELNIVKIGMEEVRNIPEDRNMYLRITETVIRKLREFFTVKINQNEIRKINPDVLALNMFSILFESIVLWKVYSKTPQYDIDKYIEDFLDITINGIKVI